MLRNLVCVAGFLLMAQITHAVASDAVPASAPKTFQEYYAKAPQVEMEKCFALPDARPKECANPDSDECRAAEEKGKDGTEFKYVPRGTCVKLGGRSMMAKRPEPKK